MFYFDSNTTIPALVFFRKLILTGCCLVTRTVKVISTDLEHGSSHIYRINKTLLASPFVHRRKSGDRFIICVELCVGEWQCYCRYAQITLSSGEFRDKYSSMYIPKINTINPWVWMGFWSVSYILIYLTTGYHFVFSKYSCTFTHSHLPEAH